MSQQPTVDGHTEPPTYQPAQAPPSVQLMPRAESDPTVGEPARTDFVDPALVAGRPIGIWVYAVALGLAALADLVNFLQIIQFVMPTQELWVHYAAVVGFTACVIFLAHFTGVILRSLKAGETWLPGYFAGLAVAVYLALGGAGLYLRLTHHDPSVDSGPVEVMGQADAQAATTPEPTPTLGASLLFLSLYLGTGLVAMLGAYATHNPARSAFAKARREHIAAVTALAESAETLAEKRAELELLQRRSAIADVIRWAEEVERRNVGEELKELVRARIAQSAQDAALTEVYLPRK
ncbi:hypothetical protein [Catellatospora sp. NPDC049609]|uniref:hypothetical protein n=1 Tax=Catellatospora sp. NPDC049609 TaxID=3155505 RepID=UPI0034140738